MDFSALPPEITSALIHSGPGAGSIMEASAAWERLGTELENSTAGYSAVLSSLAESWDGPSGAAAIQAARPYVAWMRNTAQQAQQMAYSTQAAAVAYTSAASTMVTPAQVSANRARLAQLLATNRFGNNLPAIAATEDQYQTMWANNSAAMNRYQTASSQATTTLSQFSSPASIVNPAGAAAQTTATSTSAAPGAATSAQTAIGDLLTSILSTPFGFDPNAGWFGLANTWANQFISSGFPINMLSYLAQANSAQALQSVGAEVGTGLTEGESAIGGAASGAASGLGAMGGGLGAGLGQVGTTGAIGVGVSLGKITAPPAVVGLLPAAQAPVQLASAASPLPPGDAGMPMLPPLMPPPISAGSGWRKRKQQKYEEQEYGARVKGSVMPRPPSAG
ncbi:PPE family protein [Mycobacterium parmense]|uniref:PPE domain-containing protein n=1 Tax=Mycobacterium parmense TaxID=185642 RepID=A0A7I7YWE7_9MYCO|nr:PPE family protein [Mycobacterium parmense]MCV7350947.1 PPE family protein [Mycobacterium parmense]ORW53520.1 hypothetical protein AWC20_19890 [Mycobacterium parmense]BBZ45617.1 hypothetical protein MPRM_28980 [Mycobacterium parmense]